MATTKIQVQYIREEEWSISSSSNVWHIPNI